MHSSELRGVRFPPGKRRGLFRVEGFSAEDVDDFLRECEVAVRAYENGGTPRLRSEDVVTRQLLTSARHGGSYDMDAVSEFLDRVAAALHEHEQRVP
ncbi:hypothetical protein F6B41_01625 [Microbacterium lushaniae]|nr:hypothetical protein F6B41_27930 [Microbacterium lushaniae]KAA9159175.1 hypothetical protein F6B41_01625 [Microbacterium lushaniae]